MRTLQSKSGYVDIGEAFIADRDFRDDHKATKILIRQAEAVDILSIFKQYGIILDEYNKKMCSPNWQSRCGHRSSRGLRRANQEKTIAVHEYLHC